MVVAGTSLDTSHRRGQGPRRSLRRALGQWAL